LDGVGDVVEDLISFPRDAIRESGEKKPQDGSVGDPGGDPVDPCGSRERFERPPEIYRRS
jgi:hypothetical protein